MAVEVVMPKFGLTMNDGIIKRLLKQPGDAVNEGEPLFEVETEKVLNEVPAPASGILVAFLFNEEDTVDCGVVLAVIAEPGEDVEQLKRVMRRRAGASRIADARSARQGACRGVRAGAAAQANHANRAQTRGEELSVDLAKVAAPDPAAG